ncbi:MAG TPA: DUF695 domain-containing protein [Chitinophagaceae bacterium]|nr:DUF695 domain-containing protein [Chitinophagaceae bacterium]
MKIIQTILLFCIVFIQSAELQAQDENWDNFIMSVNNHPVSIVVNLALKEKAPMKERPYLVILRTKYADVDASGFPGDSSREELIQIENELEASLKTNNGAIYAGRFTQRGLREFYFYTLDTVDYVQHCNAVMQSHSNFPWLVRALLDKTWSNYFEVLNPSDIDMEKIENRRMIKTLLEKGDNPTKTRDIEHFLYFKTQGNRRGFLTALDLPRFNVIDMPVEKTESGDYPFKLVISRQDKPDVQVMDKITIYFSQLAKKNNGRYDGWKSQVMK